MFPEGKILPGRFDAMGRLIRGVAACVYRSKRPGRISDEGRFLKIRRDFGGLLFDGGD